MSEIPASPSSDDEHDPELIQGLIDLAAKIRRDPPRTPAAAMPILDLLRLAAPGADGGGVTKLGKYTLQQSLGAGPTEPSGRPATTNWAGRSRSRFRIRTCSCSRTWRSAMRRKLS